MKGATRGLVVATAVLILLSLAVPATAVPISYEIKGVASGTIGGSAFTDALVIVTLAGDTDNVSPYPDFPGPVINLGTTSINIQGKGTATVTDDTVMFASVIPIDFDDDPNTPELPALFWATVPEQGDQVLGVIADDALLGYDLRSSFGPFTSFGGVGVNFDVVHTTMGNLFFTSGNAISKATFTATVPEPSSFMLLGMGVIALAGSRLRQVKMRSRK
jgi:hypothetical protein